MMDSLEIIVLKKKTHTLSVMFCAYNRPRYQMSSYRTIGPLVFHYVAIKFKWF